MGSAPLCLQRAHCSQLQTKQRVDHVARTVNTKVNLGPHSFFSFASCVCVCVCVCLQWICRSATLARQMEVQARQAQLSISGLWSQTTHSGVNNVEHGEQQHQRHGTKESIGGDGDLVGVSRNKDIALLQSLKVRYICDLMVEDRKVKYGMVLTSSEKVDKHSRYHSWFDLVAIPYVAAHVHVHMIAFSPLACGLVTCWLAPMCAALPRDVVVVGGGGDL
jgi:hypothetical protein